MSIYTGKCDFYDHIEICGLDNVLKSEIYLGDMHHKIEFKNELDLMQYYPHLVAFASGMKGKGTIILSRNSYIDTHEREQIGWIVRDVKREFNRCKRRKEPFVTEKVYKKISWHGRTDEILIEIIKRFAEKGNRAKFDDLHLSFFDNRRKELAKDILEEKIKNIR